MTTVRETMMTVAAEKLSSVVEGPAKALLLLPPTLPKIDNINEEALSSYLVWVTLMSSILHWSIFWICNPTSHNKKMEAKSRIASTFHAVVTSGSVMVWFLYYYITNNLTLPPFYNGQYMILETDVELFDLIIMKCVICFSIGYFVSDLVIMLLYESVYSFEAILHHIIIMPNFVLGLYYNICTPYFFMFLVEELSTPILNYRWSLLPHNNKKNVQLSKQQTMKLNTMNQLFALSFFICRLCWGSFLWYTYLPSHFSILDAQWGINENRRIISLIEYTCLVITRILNLYWFRLILLMGKKGKRRRRNDKNKKEKSNSSATINNNKSKKQD